MFRILCLCGKWSFAFHFQTFFCSFLISFKCVCVCICEQTNESVGITWNSVGEVTSIPLNADAAALVLIFVVAFFSFSARACVCACFHLFCFFVGCFRWSSNENEISQWIRFEYGFVINDAIITAIVVFVAVPFFSFVWFIYSIIAF